MSTMFQALIIEDNASTMNAFQSALSRLGWRIVVVSSIELGIEELKKGHFDAVFTELCAKEQGGRYIARWIKAEQVNTKVFILTSWKGDLEPQLLHVDGINDIIHKPLIFSEIRDKMLEYFG